MDSATIRQKLHEYINQADSKHLEAIYLLLKKELEPSYKYDSATLDMLYKRREAHLSEQSVSYTVDEALASMRNAKK
jgi:hypothetical protein